MNNDLLAKPIFTASDLHRYWQELMSPLGFTGRRLYFFFLDEERHALRTLHEVSEIPARPTTEGVEGLISALSLLDGDFGIAILLARPGSQPMDDDDRAWARGLAEAARSLGVPLEPMHLATDRYLVPFAGDDLIG